MNALFKSFHLVNFATVHQVFSYVRLVPQGTQYQFLPLCLWLLYFLCAWLVLVFLASKCSAIHVNRSPPFCPKMTPKLILSITKSCSLQIAVRMQRTRMQLLPCP